MLKAMVNDLQIKDLQTKLNYFFNDVNLLSQALTHTSYYSNSLKPNNERMEFLGDKILAIAIADIIYKRFATYQEDKLSQMFSYLTSQAALDKIGHNLKLKQYVKHNSNINSKILSSALEAIIAAIYLDADLTAARTCITNLWSDEIEAITQHDAYTIFNPKSYLQNWVQQKNLPLPLYKDLEKIGQEHKPIFEVELRVDGFSNTLGKGASKKLAQKDAASKFITKYINVS